MATGTVKWFNETKGFGFITPDEGSKDCFVHVNEIASGPINDGDKVEFEMGEGRKGPMAVGVKKV